MIGDVNLLRGAVARRKRAHALLGRGRCLLAIGRSPEAIASLREAREIFASLDARPALAEVDGLLGGATALTS
jgi:hypothetical protein